MKTYVITISNMFDFVEKIVCYCDSLDDALTMQKRLKENNSCLDYRIRLIEKHWHNIICVILYI